MEKIQELPSKDSNGYRVAVWKSRNDSAPLCEFSNKQIALRVGANFRFSVIYGTLFTICMYLGNLAINNLKHFGFWANVSMMPALFCAAYLYQKRGNKRVSERHQYPRPCHEAIRVLSSIDNCEGWLYLRDDLLCFDSLDSGFALRKSDVEIIPWSHRSFTSYSLTFRRYRSSM